MFSSTILKTYVELLLELGFMVCTSSERPQFFSSWSAMAQLEMVVFLETKQMLFEIYQCNIH